jgi:hypothetical protein
MYKVNESQTPWDLAIEDAKQQISTLKRSIQIFMEARERGEKWRGDILPTPQSSDHKSEAATQC